MNEAAPLRERARRLFASTQETICEALERLDGGARFEEDRWDYRPGRAEHESGGGITRVIADGDLFERGGVNFSAVQGSLTDTMAERLGVTDRDFFATGLSLVLHPGNPHVPTVHMNVRYFEVGATAWFGGGADLTPYYLVEEDVIHFHRTWKRVCDRHEVADHARYKRACDTYFHNKHRNEARGVGGIFYDYQKENLPQQFDFTKDLATSFQDAYWPIAEKRKDTPFTAGQKTWQELRRGRYVEFNLVWDRGTHFGLETGGRTESILMSLPPKVQWAYNHHPQPNTEESRLLELLVTPKDWV